MFQSTSHSNTGTGFRVSGLVIKGSEDIAGSPSTLSPAQCAPAVWRALDVCVAVEEKHRGALESKWNSGNNAVTTTSAFTVLDIKFALAYHSVFRGPDASILRLLTTHYAALVGSLRVLRVEFVAYDESGDLAALLAVATRMQELSFEGSDFSSLAGLEGRGKYLEKLNVSCCSRLQSLAGVEGHEYLKEIDASFTSVASIRELGTCPALTTVSFAECEELDSMEGLEDHLWLQEVNLSSTAITSVELLSTCPALTIVDLYSARGLESIAGLKNHVKLIKVNISATAVQSITQLATCPALVVADVSQCELESLAGLENHKHLEEVDASVTRITSVNALRSCPAMTMVNLSSCVRLPHSTRLPEHVTMVGRAYVS